MARDNMAGVYDPLICGTDKLVRRPIRPWRAAMRESLRLAVGNGDEPDFGGIAVALNQLALLEAYEGSHANALSLCHSQIAYWNRLAARGAAWRHLQACVIQPLINIVRLERWTATAQGPVSLYCELAPARRGVPGPLQAQHGVAHSFEQLCALDDKFEYTRLLDKVYWREYGRCLLQAGRDDELRDFLGAGLSQPQTPFVQLSLVEILLLQQARAGKHDSAARLLANLALPPDNLLWLHFKVCEMFLAIGRATPAAEATRDVMDAVRAGHGIRDDGYGLNLLFDISKVFRALGCGAEEAELLGMAAHAAVRLDDEAVRFDVLERMAALDGTPRTALQQQFPHARYVSIRKRLGLAPAAPDPESALVVEAAQHLARLDYAACLGLLDAAEPALAAA